jgi:hypothetical protein
MPRVCLTVATPVRQHGLQGQILAITNNAHAASLSKRSNQEQVGIPRIILGSGWI